MLFRIFFIEDKKNQLRRLVSLDRQIGGTPHGRGLKCLEWDAVLPKMPRGTDAFPKKARLGFLRRRGSRRLPGRGLEVPARDGLEAGFDLWNFGGGNQCLCLGLRA